MISAATNKENQNTVLVTDARLGSAVAIIRSLGCGGWRVIAGDSDPHAPGLSSRYAQDRLIYPAPRTAPVECMNALFSAARESGVDLIIPVSDELIVPLSHARNRFDGVCTLALPDSTALEVTRNKFQTLQLAESLGVPVPRTHLVHTASEAEERAETLGWPIVLKPQASRLFDELAGVKSLAVCYANNRAQLVRQMRQFERYCPVLLQEYYPGVGCGVELLTHNGRVLAAFQHKRLREIPVNGGASAFRQSVAIDPTLYQHSVRLLEELSWTGLAMIEFKVGDRGPKLMEINGRVWGSLPLAVYSGIDFPALLADLCVNGPPDASAAPRTSYTIGVRSRNLLLEMVWVAQVLYGRRRYPFLGMPNRRQAVTALLQLLNPRCKFDILSLRDPWPGVAEFFKIAEKAASTIEELVQAKLGDRAVGVVQAVRRAFT